MRLTKLEINGFKSFARKTEIDFEAGMTAIVGPNGSGKSNIADAVRWVLGEQSARVLRGARMEDVIFNGTEQRKPQSFCEVALTFDNTDGSLPTEFTEVSVMRRVYRSGESEYFINRSACRLRDIHELFRDTGIGKEGYSIIGQGKVEEILSNKSDDRRAAFEEAAGVMKYRVRKEEAERKLENTKKNLVRLTDILEELEKQIGPLEEQSAAAREYLKLRDELKDIEINVFIYQYDKLTERLKNLADSMEELSGRIDSSALAEAALAEECAALEEKERMLGVSMTGVQNRLLTLSSCVESHSGEGKVINERMGNLIKERERIEAELAENAARHDELSGLIKSSSLETAGNSEKLAQAEAELADIEAKLADVTSAISEKEERLETQKNSVMEAMNRLSDAKSLITRLVTIKGTLLERLEAIDGEEKETAQKGGRLDEEFAGANAALEKLQREYSRLDGERKAAAVALNEMNMRLADARDEIVRMEKAAESGRSRIQVLDEMKRAHEGYYASVRNVLRDSERDIALKKCIEGVVAELIRVPEQYETAVEMTLGSALQNIVTPDEQCAKRVIEHLRSRQYGRATLLPVSAMRPRLLSTEERAMCAADGFLGVASELISYDARYKGIVENLLGRTVIVRDLDAGIAINRRAHSAFRIATLQGDIINPGGSMTGGSTQKREFSLIGREREIEELTEKLQNFTRTIEARRAECEKLQSGLSDANAAVETASARVNEKNVELASQREKVDIIKKYVLENREQLDAVALERSQINDNLADIDEQCVRAEQDRTGLEEGNVATQDDIRATQDELNAARTRFNAVNEEATAHKVRMMELQKELGAAENERRRIEREEARLSSLIDAGKAALEKAETDFSLMKDELVSIGSRIDVERKDVDEVTDQLRVMEEERSAAAAALDDARRRREELAGELSELRERRHRSELNQNKSEMELAAIQDRIWEDYELTYENAQPMCRQIAITASHMQIDALKKDIRALGDVNVNSIDDYKNVKERFDSLKVQCDDLTKAESDLQVLIADLVSTMESEFKRQFELIQQNFSQTFTELFGGGRAELLLSDKNDILNCDIDIIAQPPGKKLQLLSLLSGGERALTAIALLFAILKLKPTAFCILDEIETSLDEVNVSNFASYVRNYSKNTQFVLITHRKGSMEACDNLYGVAQEEKGVSRIVSAKFREGA